MKRIVLKYLKANADTDLKIILFGWDKNAKHST